MSAAVALANIRLEPADRWGHTEYSLEYHRQFLQERTGLPAGHAEFARRGYEAERLDR